MRNDDWQSLKWRWTKEEDLQDGKIPPWARHYEPTLHFCPEWDFMVIDRGDEEFQCCCRCYDPNGGVFDWTSKED